MARKLIKSDALTLWQSKNPLRTWLYTQGHPQQNRRSLLATTGVGRQAMHHWLQGSAVPGLEKFPALTKLTGITLDQWMVWYHAMPQPPSSPAEDAPCVVNSPSTRKRGSRTRASAR